MTVEVLTRAKGLLNNISPTGVQYVIEPVPTGQALYRIRSKNKTGPEVIDLAGTFTSVSKAQTILTKYLNEVWEYSDSVAAKSKSKRDAA